MHALLFLALFQAAPATEPLRSGCLLGDEQIAAVGAGDRVQVEMALAGEDQTCYKVTLLRPSQSLTGYVLGESLPAVATFVRRREDASKESAEAEARFARVPDANLAKSEPGKSLDPLISTQFEDFSGRDAGGKAVSLSGLKGRAVLVTFWSPKSGVSQRQLTSVMPLYNKFHNSGLAAVGVSMDPNASHITEALDDVTPSWPQIPDRSGLAAHYRVDPRAGKTFVLDSSHRIVAAGPMGPDIEKAVRELLATPENQ